MKSAIECMWASRMQVPSSWPAIANGLQFEFIDSQNGILQPFDTFDPSNNPQLSFPTTLFPLHPFWIDAFKRLLPGYTDQMTPGNKNYALQYLTTPTTTAADAIVAAVSANILNSLGPSSSAASTAQTDFSQYLTNLVQAITSTSMDQLLLNDCCALLLSTLGIGGVSIRGGIQSNGIPYSRLEVYVGVTAYMPLTWQSLVAKLPNGTFTIYNSST